MEKELLLKAIVYRAITILSSFIVVMLITKDDLTAWKISIITEAFRFVTYYMYDVFWKWMMQNEDR